MNGMATRTTMNNEKGINTLLSKLFSPVDNASLTVFRIGWGAILTAWCWDYLTSGRVTELYVKPSFHFTYLYFDWVHPWPGSGMYLHFAALLVLSLAILVGFWYRISSTLFAIGFTYIFLLEQTNYQNHYYLVMLISWANILLPLHRNLSWDARRRKGCHSETAPSWALWMIRFHIGIPYFYGGLAKLIPDWMLGEPMRTMLLSKTDTPIIGQWFGMSNAGLLFSWGGIFLDLCIVPLLMYRKTRLIAYLTCVAFHLTNAVLFQIHIFPWFMIIATTIFFEPDWPRRFFGIAPIAVPVLNTRLVWSDLSAVRKFSLVFFAMYLGFHLVWPLRYQTYAGDSSWTEQGHFFSWRMMLRGKTGGVRYFVTDPVLNQTFLPDLRTRLNLEQVGKFPKNPEWVLQLAHHLADDYEQSQGRRPEVRALVLLSLNGRKPQLLIDPNVDLVGEQLGQRQRDWVLPTTEPLRKESWDVPLLEWERTLELPPLEFLKKNPIQFDGGNTNEQAQ
jgi:hypothetical protein